MTAVYTIADIRKLEKLAVKSYDIPESSLMQNAGMAAYRVLREHWPNDTTICVFCGKGNNGGDGCVLAREAVLQGLNVYVRFVGDLDGLTQVANAAMSSAKEVGVDIKPFIKDEILDADVFVDALLGIGIQGEVHGDYRQAIEKINATQKPVLAIDAPSGLDVDTGNVLGVAVKASVTVTFIGLKQGLFTGMAPNYCGKIICEDLQLPKAAFTEIATNVNLIEASEIAEALPKRPRAAHKGANGHVLIIGGNYGMAGAVRMAAEACLRVGAGLVSVATREEHVSVVSSERPEIMCRGIKTPANMQDLLRAATVIVIGPGLGQDEWANDLLQIILQTEQAKVIDADGLNILATHQTKNENWVLTPHPGEAGRLLENETKSVQADRFTAINQIQNKYKGVCVLKGAGSLVKGKNSIGICAHGNPGMATAGMGDVLSGIIGGLIAQGLALEQAARVGVLLHAKAADNVAKQQGERGMLALDLLQELPRLINP